MTSTTFQIAFQSYDEAAALARLDADLAIAAGTRELQALRRNAVAAYRDALTYAAGQANDPHWFVLIGTVAEFIARVPAGRRTRESAAAVARLNALVEENRA